MSMFRPATRKKLKARIALDGPSGSGKTYTALRLATGLARRPDGSPGRVAVIDTEHRSASKYVGESPDGVPLQFDTCELVHYAPTTYTAAIRECGRAGYDVLVIDSLSHAWEGVGGALDQVDKKGGNSFTAWKDVTPQHRELIEAILACPCHVIATMRTKTDYVLEEHIGKDGRKTTVPKRIGLAPVQRAGMEYEFDVVCDLDLTHLLTVSKTRCSALDGMRVVCPTMDFATPIRQWLEVGEEEQALQPVPAGCDSSPPPAHPQSPSQSLVDVAILDSAAGSALAVAGAYQEFGSALCTAGRQQRIITLAESLQMEPNDIAVILANRGVNKLVELTNKQADEILAKLEAAATEQGAPF